MVEILKSDRSSCGNTINALSIFNASKVIWSNLAFTSTSRFKVLKVFISIDQFLFFSSEVLHEHSQFIENVSWFATTWWGLTIVLAEHGRGQRVAVWVWLSAVGEWCTDVTASFTLSVDNDLNFLCANGNTQIACCSEGVNCALFLESVCGFSSSLVAAGAFGHWS